MFNPDYKDLLRLFTEHGVEYVVVGAYAMAAHGVVRATGDIDLFVRATSKNGAAVFDVLTEIDGVSYEDVGRVMVNVDDLTVP